MTRAYRIKAGVIAVAVLAVIIACVLLTTRRSQPDFLSLVFERYSTRSDFFVQDVAFLQLSNSSDRTYYVPMTGGTNTLLPDAPLAVARYKDHGGLPSQSYLVNCEFSDQKSSMSQLPVASWGQCATLAPHSAIRVRVPLPPEGGKRKVAVFCAEMPKGPRLFWTKGIGLTVFRMLPRSWGRRLLFPQPEVEKVWLDGELSRPGEAVTKK